jgi:hypothetical protein
MASGAVDEAERVHSKNIDVAVIESVRNLVDGNGEVVELNLEGRALTAESQTYQDNRGARKLFILRDATAGDLVAYMDVGLDITKRVASCDERSLHATTDEETLEALRDLGPFREGFATTDGEREAGNLLVGLAIYALGQEGCGTVSMREYIPNEDDDVFGDTGPQRANYRTIFYHGVTPEIRTLAAKSLSKTPSF